jgi:hypothetical protein
MRNAHETVNRTVRAAELRATARQLDAAGFRGLAAVNRELADWIEPQEDHRPRRRPHHPHPGVEPSPGSPVDKVRR